MSISIGQGYIFAPVYSLTISGITLSDMNYWVKTFKRRERIKKLKRVFK